MAPEANSTRPLSRQDAASLVGVLAGLEGHLVAGDLSPHVIDRLGERLEGPGFASEADVQAFVGAVRGQRGTTSATVPVPVPVDGRSYDDGTVRWQVAVRSTTLPLSAEFDTERGQLLALAAEHGGRDGGWGTPPDVRS